MYRHDKYRNKNIQYLISNEIIEYDIRSAGYSISRYYNLLDNKTLDKLENMSNKQRHIAIGLLQRNDKVYNERLKQAFIDIRREFFIANKIEDRDVLSIKKDAIFLLRRIDQTKFGDTIEFRNKNTYTSYYYINRKEFYNNKETIDVKGISDEKLELHRDYMLDFLHNIFCMMETSSNAYVIKELVSFIDHYKSKMLEVGYYRELNDDSAYRLNNEYVGYELGLDIVDDVTDINISYNYMNYIRPLIEILM